MADNELTVANGNNFAANGANAVSHFFNTDTMDGKMALYNAMQTADKVDEHLNEPLHVTNVLAQAIEVANQEPAKSTLPPALSSTRRRATLPPPPPHWRTLSAICSPFSARRTRGTIRLFLRWWKRRVAVDSSSSTLN